MPLNPSFQGNLMIGRHRFRQEELLPSQKEAIDKLEAFLENILSRVENSQTTPQKKNRKEYDKVEPRTQFFSIFGERGQGKTATLVSLCARLSDKCNTSYLVAPLFKPELILSGEKIFPAIIYNLFLAFQSLQKGKSEFEGEDPLKQTRLGTTLSKFVEEYLARFGKGEELMAELSANLESYARSVMDRSAFNFAAPDRLAKWIDSFLKEFDRKILIFPIDDVDICRELSEDVLKAVRMYLSHPRVVVIMTADLEAIRRSIRNRHSPTYLDSILEIA